MSIQSLHRKTCPNCSVNIPADASVCPLCDYPLEPVKYCPGCAMYIDKGLWICPTCGYEFPDPDDYFPGGGFHLRTGRIIKYGLIIGLLALFILLILKQF
jgi:RNA polymerase subunit RPABC4/transcription elongation factor Spt4